MLLPHQHAGDADQDHHRKEEAHKEQHDDRKAHEGRRDGFAYVRPRLLHGAYSSTFAEKGTSGATGCPIAPQERSKASAPRLAGAKTDAGNMLIRAKKPAKLLLATWRVR